MTCGGCVEESVGGDEGEEVEVTKSARKVSENAGMHREVSER
jgi:hypothetical protein